MRTGNVSEVGVREIVVGDGASVRVRCSATVENEQALCAETKGDNSHREPGLFVQGSAAASAEVEGE